MKTDKNDKTNSGLKSRPEQLNNSHLARIDYARRRMNRALDTVSVLALLNSETPRLFDLAEVVGKWVWIQFGGKQPNRVTRVLSEFGFHWNKARQTWQHPCGVDCEASSPKDPREKYGGYFPAKAA